VTEPHRPAEASWFRSSRGRRFGREFAAIADDIVCPRAPEHFAAVGQWYDDFRQTTDEEVRELLHTASSEPAGKPR